VKKYVEKSPEKSCTKEKFGAVSHKTAADHTFLDLRD
jgi:hypothetical protein